ncbi:hypothetical protein OIU34_00495 [Pararhizobium sp. BT-229]|uniref:hypothetical protein n=1 Tax=Pararhizobium sp. BT-229 TaxID=2986923 RepID=UPI0021F79F9D|nr:hypothetical protein [Pararhizobium sp. BT-229]MCV9960364.1 hypothetical protein [Pararhizobium sp. BT-229]
MTATTDFIAELFRAANEIDKLATLEKGRLLQRAIVTVRDMRDVVGIPTSGTEADALIDIGAVAASIDRTPNQDVRAALLEAAGMIRDLRIVMDSKIEVIVKTARDLSGPT